jgi:hypothetical protein
VERVERRICLTGIYFTAWQLRKLQRTKLKPKWINKPTNDENISKLKTKKRIAICLVAHRPRVRLVSHANALTALTATLAQVVNLVHLETVRIDGKFTMIEKRILGVILSESEIEMRKYEIRIIARRTHVVRFTASTARITRRPTARFSATRIPTEEKEETVEIPDVENSAERE